MDMVGGIIEVLKRHEQKIADIEASLANILTALEHIDALLKEVNGITEEPGSDTLN